MPISTVYILKYVNNAKFKWFELYYRWVGGSLRAGHRAN